jgi:uncharacterized repeat protein (TIGR01451 family)
LSNPLLAALASLAIAAAALPSAAAQQGPDALESRLVARKVLVAEGRERLVDAAQAKPGDVIEYVATYRNAGKDAIRGLQATLPIPPQTEYIPGSARPAQAQATADGLTYAAIPLRRTVTREGQAVDVAVPYREYRALRWHAGELASGKAVAFTARVRVLQE